MNQIDIKLPDLGEGVLEGELLSLKIKEGEEILKDQAIIEVMKDKASMEVPSRFSGKVISIPVKEGDMIQIGQVICTLETKEKELNPSSLTETKEPTPAKDKKIKPEIKPQVKSLDGALNRVKAAPITRRLAKDFGIDLDKSFPSAETVTREDLISYIKNNQSMNKPQSMNKTPSSNEPLVVDEERRVPIRGIQRLMFESMSLSKQTIPHFTLIDQADVTNLIQLRESLKPKAAEENCKLTYLAFIMRACIDCLKNNPIFYSSVDPQSKEVVYKKFLNLGFATDTPSGLLVPCIHQVDKLNLFELAKQIQNLSQQARDSTIERENLQGAGFSLTNLGSIGMQSGTPIIQPPQVSILGIYKMYDQVQKHGDEVVSKKFMNLSITCDHRVIDGAKAAYFLRDVIKRIEEPGGLVLS